MTWFTYTKNSVSTYASVRRKILFPIFGENLKIGDWIHVNLNSLDIGRLFYYENGLIKNKIDSDSYIVVHELENVYTPTYSLILGEPNEPQDSLENYSHNLWFKSVTECNAGSQLKGEYYIYYHKDDIQYISLVSGSYVSTTPPSGNNYIASENQASTQSINKHTTVVNNSSSNNRVASLAFLGSPENWLNNQTSTIGAKAIGVFNGPELVLYAEKGPDCGIIRLKITKTSATGSGQKIIKSNIDIDLYSATKQENQNIYNLNIISENIFSTYEEIYKDFSFEIEVLANKNQSSSGNRCKIEKYTFSKEYNLLLDNEEIKSDIVFKSIGGLK